MIERATAHVEGHTYTVLVLDRAEDAYMVQTTDPQDGTFHLTTCGAAPACTCKAGQYGFRRLARGVCIHVLAARVAAAKIAMRQAPREGVIATV